MLVEFDAGSMDLVTFSSTYYPQETKQASFEQFCTKVIEPFKLALVSLVVEGIDEEPKSVERTVEFASSGLHQQTEYLLVNIYNTVQDAEITLDERADYMVMLEGFAAALDARDSLMIKAIWLGLRKALTAQRLCKKKWKRWTKCCACILSQNKQKTLKNNQTRALSHQNKRIKLFLYP